MTRNERRHSPSFRSWLCRHSQLAEPLQSLQAQSSVKAPRNKFSENQTNALLHVWHEVEPSPYPSVSAAFAFKLVVTRLRAFQHLIMTGSLQVEQIRQLACETGLAEHQIKNWFANRRRRYWSPAKPLANQSHDQPLLEIDSSQD